MDQESQQPSGIPPASEPAASATDSPGESGTSTQAQPRPAPPQTKTLPPWRVILHNDEVNDVVHVVESILKLTPLKQEEAINRTLEAHHRGRSMLLVTHRERAELYACQFASQNLNVTIEPAEA